MCRLHCHSSPSEPHIAMHQLWQPASSTPLLRLLCHKPNRSCLGPRCPGKKCHNQVRGTDKSALLVWPGHCPPECTEASPVDRVAARPPTPWTPVSNTAALMPCLDKPWWWWQQAMMDVLPSLTMALSTTTMDVGRYMDNSAPPGHIYGCYCCPQRLALVQSTKPFRAYVQL